MGFIEEEHQGRLFGIADFGQGFEQLGQQIEQEGGVKLGVLHQLVGGEDVDHALAVLVHADEIVDLEGWLAKEPIGALAFEGQQLALDRADRGLGNIAIGRGQLAGILGAGHQRLLQIIHVEQQQAVVVGPLESDGQHAFLRLVQAHQPAEQQRAHFRNGGADRVALLAVKVPEYRRIVLIDIVGDAQFRRAAFQLVGVLEIVAAGHRHAGQVALHVGHEHRHPGGGELLGDGLERDGLAGAGRTRDQPVAVGAAQPQHLALTVATKAEEDLAHVMLLKMRLDLQIERPSLRGE